MPFRGGLPLCHSVSRVQLWSTIGKRSSILRTPKRPRRIPSFVETRRKLRKVDPIDIVVAIEIEGKQVIDIATQGSGRIAGAIEARREDAEVDPVDIAIALPVRRDRADAYAQHRINRSDAGAIAGIGGYHATVVALVTGIYIENL